MILELVGSRILAPYLGTSIVVWTSLIGIILGSLSVGYWYGGKLADRNPNNRTFSGIILISSVLVGIIPLIKGPVLESLQAAVSSFSLNAILATVVLFALPSIALGMVSPYAVRLRMQDLTTSGSTVGRLYAVSTVGSIAGTFLAGFYLIAYFGSSKILFVLSATLLFTSVLAYGRGFFAARAALLAVLAISAAMVGAHERQEQRLGIYAFDTLYSHVQIYPSVDESNGRRTIAMVTNPKETQSAMYVDSPSDLVLRYTRFYRLVHHFRPDTSSALMIGGAGYSYPKNFLASFPHARMDVVEIDPDFTSLARRYFALPDDRRLRIYHEDGRTYLNRATEKYDVIFGDAFSSFYSVPYQLTTLETVRRIYGALNDRGVVLMNIISSIEGETGEFLRAELATFRAVFPQVYLFAVRTPADGADIQNIMLVALKSKAPPSFRSDDAEMKRYLTHRWGADVPADMPILTDEHAPVDAYMLKVIRAL
ncbi:MAG TPA: fused MFS/spermidine synthase [Dissulfurispiraceae bacterium]|nr:fused MFS/spermidine synthase [Dissulfurispiraceae bacterium]